MMWAHGWLSRQAREPAAFEDVARAAKCQKKGRFRPNTVREAIQLLGVEGRR